MIEILYQGPEASGTVGPFDYEPIQVEPDLEDPAEVAVARLEDNGYDVDGIGADLLRPYLLGGNKLLAVRLTKGNDAGSIRPLSIGYPGSPAIPIRPTAVAANDDMGVLVWVAGGARARRRQRVVLQRCPRGWARSAGAGRRGFARTVPVGPHALRPKAGPTL